MWAYETNKKKTVREINKVINETKKELASYESDGSTDDEFYRGFLHGTVELLEEYLETVPNQRVEFVNHIHSKYEATIWYERKLVMFMNIQEGIEDLTSAEQSVAISKAMIKAEEDYGVDPNGVYSDFTWGIWNAYLFGSRWIGGDEFLSLDT